MLQTWLLSVHLHKCVMRCDSGLKELKAYTWDVCRPSMQCEQLAQCVAKSSCCLPVRNERKPPVSAPAAMLFQGSSLCRTATSVQSNVENRPPHTAKLPPILGASRLIACTWVVKYLISQ